MLDSILEEKYKKLQERERKYQRYRRPASWISNSSLWVVFVVFGAFLIGYFVFNVQFGVLVIFVLIFGWQFIGLLITGFLNKKASVYNLDSDEWAIFYSCSVLENTQNYLESRTSRLKEEYRKNALRSGKKLLSTIEKKWKIGNFRLAKAILGDTISKLKDNIRNKLIPNLEIDNEQTIRELEKIMYNFVQHLLRPTVDGFNHVNKMMVNVTSHKPAKLGFYERCSSFLAKYTVLKHVLAIAIFGFVSCFVFLLGMNYVQISKEGSFVAAVSLFGILVAGYWQRSK